MPARRHHFKKCGHLGFGAECHRCAQAEALDAQAAKIMGKKTEKDKCQSMVDEANRLRTISGNLSDALPRPQPHPSSET